VIRGVPTGKWATLYTGGLSIACVFQLTSLKTLQSRLFRSVPWKVEFGGVQAVKFGMESDHHGLLKQYLVPSVAVILNLVIHIGV
jgi:hypothetical protein